MMKTIAEIREFIQGIPIHKIINEKDDSENFTTLMELLKKHETWKERTSEITQFQIISNRQRQRLLQVFVSSRTRGSKWQTISWRKCHESKKSTIVKTTTPLQKLKQAMRNSIRYQVTRWKRINFINRSCQICQSTKHLEADHVIGFKILSNQFLESTSLIIPTEFVYKRKNKLEFNIKNENDKKFRKQWQLYHQKTCQFQWLCKTCNIHKH